MKRARVLAEDCEYKDKEEQLIDTLIFGVLPINVRRKLLTKDNALKLNDTMKIAHAEEATQKHVSALQESKQLVQYSLSPEAKALSKTSLITQLNLKGRHLSANMSNSNKDVLVVDSITTGKPPAQRTKPPATSVVKRATGKKSASLNSTARKVKASKRLDASQQPETNSMHLNTLKRQTARTLTKQLTSPLTL